jgi:hypothetical protein
MTFKIIWNQLTMLDIIRPRHAAPEKRKRRSYRKEPPYYRDELRGKGCLDRLL